MKITTLNPPREFSSGVEPVTMRQCATIELADDELVTFVTPAGREYDFAAKSWGFYSTPSLNKRLVDQGFKTALVRNGSGRYFINAVDVDAIDGFLTYLATEQSELIEWLDERP
jgi:hypothetical protein